MIIASDFDGTIYVNHKMNPKNIDFIRKFKSEGNIFGITTGRDLYMTKLEIEKYQIPFDFIVCNNGTVTYNNEYEVIDAQTLDRDVYLRLITDELINTSYYIVISNPDGRFIIEGFDDKGTAGQYYTEIISLEKAKKLENVYQVDTKFVNHDKVIEVSDILMKRYPEIQLHPNIETIDYAPLDTNKCNALDKVVEYYNDHDVITIGDGLNDYRMIEKYHGYAMENGLEVTKEVAFKVLKNFYDLEEEIKGRKNEKL